MLPDALVSVDAPLHDPDELGAGTGLVSLTAAACGATVLATDYREEPLELLGASAQRSSEHLGSPLVVRTRAFDIKSSEPLPPANIVVAADLLYLRSTSQALARRCAAAGIHAFSCRTPRGSSGKSDSSGASGRCARG